MTPLCGTQLTATSTLVEAMSDPVYFGGCSYVVQSHDVSSGSDQAYVRHSNNPHEDLKRSENTESDVTASNGVSRGISRNAVLQILGTNLASFELVVAKELTIPRIK